jgi:hypothetical protein
VDYWTAGEQHLRQRRSRVGVDGRGQRGGSAYTYTWEYSPGWAGETWYHVGDEQSFASDWIPPDFAFQMRVTVSSGAQHGSATAYVHWTIWCP